jgi:hypothetical protein
MEKNDQASPLGRRGFLGGVVASSAATMLATAQAAGTGTNSSTSSKPSALPPSAHGAAATLRPQVKLTA